MYCCFSSTELSYKLCFFPTSFLTCSLSPLLIFQPKYPTVTTSKLQLNSRSWTCELGTVWTRHRRCIIHLTTVARLKTSLHLHLVPGCLMSACFGLKIARCVDLF